MKNHYLSSALTLFFLFLFPSGFSQDLDLIVTTKGDSIACRIDSITQTHIYFEMKSVNIWAHTLIGLTDVSEYKRKTIHGDQFVYKTGTSIIESPKPKSSGSIRDIQRNSIYAGIFSINYGRMIPGDRIGVTFGGGLYHMDATGFVVESTILTGGLRHYFESGIMGFCLFDLSTGTIADDGDTEFAGATLRLGYRYQGPGGLLIRAAPNLAFFISGEVWLMPALSLGYSF